MMRSWTLLLPSLIGLTAASCMHGTSFQKRSTGENATVEVSEWGYEGLIGPMYWQTLAADNSICETGTHQGPINLDGTVPITKSKIEISFPSSSSPSFELENLGTTVEVLSVADGSGSDPWAWSTTTTSDPGNAYNFVQFHFHTPSEHHVNGESFPLEMHVVHQSPTTKGLLVLTLLFDLDSNPANTSAVISRVGKDVTKIEEPGSYVFLEDPSTVVEELKAIANVFETSPLREYSGSLTTPPCAEDVMFFIADQIMSIDVESYNNLKRVLKFNARFTQGPVGQPNILETMIRETVGMAVLAKI